MKNINYDDMTLTEIKEEMQKLVNKVEELEYEKDIYEDTIRLYKKGLVKKIINNELDSKNPIEVPMDQFCDIYNECIGYCFENNPLYLSIYSFYS